MLTLPTGTSGVLYRPSFFHRVVFDHVLISLTKTGDDLMFRLAAMVNGIAVVTACLQPDHWIPGKEEKIPRGGEKINGGPQRNICPWKINVRVRVIGYRGLYCDFFFSFCIGAFYIVL